MNDDVFVIKNGTFVPAARGKELPSYSENGGFRYSYTNQLKLKAC